MQTSPTSPVGLKTNTHPTGAWLPPLNIIQACLGFTNASFVARTMDWNPLHLYQTLKMAYEHKGMSFVQILQRCPQYTSKVWLDFQNNPDRILLMNHEKGIPVDDAVGRMHKNQIAHDPADIHEARRLAEAGSERLAVGLFYHNPNAPRYDLHTAEGMGMAPEKKVEAINEAFDRFAV